MKKFLLPVSVALLALLIFLPQFLVKVKVECRSQYGSCPEDMQSLIDSGRRLNLIQAKKQIRNELKGNPLVLDYSMQFKLPNILGVNILIKKPAFAFQDKSTGKIYLVDTAGKIISEETATPLPLLIQDGTGVNLFALKVVSGVFSMYQVTKGEIKDGSLVVELPGQVSVIFPVEGDSEILLGALRLIYARIQNDGEKKYSEIDLRFKNPVLR